MASFDENDDEGLDDPEAPDESDRDQDDGNPQPETIPCPYCGRTIFEEAEMCPNCGRYISKADKPFSVPMWIIVAALICLAIVFLFWVLLGFTD